jgi:hypothetical protein
MCCFNGLYSVLLFFKHKIKPSHITFITSSSFIEHYFYKECCHVLGYSVEYSVCEPTLGGIFSTLAPCSADFLPLKMEVICSSETSVHVRTTRRYIPEDGDFHNYRCENLKSYIFFTSLTSKRINTVNQQWTKQTVQLHVILWRCLLVVLLVVVYHVKSKKRKAIS